jgi:hypothetical protein
MRPTVNGRSVRELTPLLFRSDAFKNLYELIQLFPGLVNLLQSVIRVEMVIDANVVLSEIRFRLRRRNPEARSDLGEAIDSGVVIVIAPRRLISEIDDEHLSRILDGTGKTVVDARREWEQLRPKIHLYQPMSEGDSALRAIDPDDVPYAVTCEETGAHAIHSRDNHLKRMGAPVVKGTPDRALRDCARSGAVIMGVAASSGFAITVTYASVRGIWSLLEKALGGLMLPTRLGENPHRWNGGRDRLATEVSRSSGGEMEQAPRLFRVDGARHSRFARYPRADCDGISRG